MAKNYWKYVTYYRIDIDLLVINDILSQELKINKFEITGRKKNENKITNRFKIKNKKIIAVFRFLSVILKIMKFNKQISLNFLTLYIIPEKLHIYD